MSVLEKDTVEYDGKVYEVKVKNGLKTLKLYNMKIKDITDIKGLDKLTDLQVLNLASNKITEIKGLENLTNLEKLYLYNNEITEIKGLENMTKLRYFTVWKNPYHKLNKDKFGGTGSNGQYKDPQAVVKYCQLTPDQREAELEEEERSIEERITKDELEEDQLEDDHIETEEQVVEFDGKLYEVKMRGGLKTLKLYNKGVKKITDIKGLDELTDLQVLNLASNEITEIKGLENLVNLEKLYLYNNEITEIKGLQNMTKLHYFTVWKNPFHKLNKDEFGGTGSNGQYKDPQAVVRYCRLTPKQREEERNIEERLIEEELEDDESEDDQIEIEFIGDDQIELEKQSVEYDGEMYEVKIKNGLKTLKLYNMGIKNITDIKGLDKLTDLQVLNLANNEITEIKGLDNLTNLEKLYLYKNQITEIEGIDNLTNLRYFTVWKNPFHEVNEDKFGGTGFNGQYKDPQAAVEYSRHAPERKEARRLEAERLKAERLEAERLRKERIEQKRIEKEKKEERIKDETTQNIKKLSIAYKEITFEKISSKTGLGIEYLENLVEDLIFNREIDAKIDGGTLIFKKAVPVSNIKQREIIPNRIETEKSTEPKRIKNNIIVFVSYATMDEELFRVREIAEILTRYENIEDVLYWQEDTKDNIIKYMSDNVARCDVMLLFCSPNALKSKPIEKEWTTADIMNKPIIPIFVRSEHIPPLLMTRLGVEFDTFDQQKTIDEIYSLILKKA
ncbi:MAG: leucine-rich repeat domain-containing protein [Candidatus Hermodarchaeota archaeon]